MPRQFWGHYGVNKWAWTLSGVAAFLGAWTVASIEIGNPILLPDPAAVAIGFVSLIKDGTLVGDVAASLKRVLGGFAVASALAVPLALVMAFWRPVNLLFSPIITFLASDPSDRVDSACDPVVRHRRSSELFHHRDRRFFSDFPQ